MVLFWILSAAAAWAQTRLRIESEPEGAVVYRMDAPDDPLGETPLTIRLPKGEHELELRLDGYLPVRKTVFVKGRGTQSLSVTLEEAKATLVVRGPRGARVLLDGTRIGKLPFSGEVAAGARLLQVELPGGEVFEQFTELAAGQEVVVDAGPITPVEDPVDPVEPDPPPPTSDPILVPATPHDQPRLTATVVTRLLQRDFIYAGNQTRATLFDLEQRGEIALGVRVAYVPAKNGWARGITLVVEGTFAMPQSITGDATLGVGDLTTNALDLSARLRYEHGVGPARALRVGGEVAGMYTARGTSGVPLDVERTPQTQVLALAPGALIGYRTARWDVESLGHIWLGSDSALEDRFAGVTFSAWDVSATGRWNVARRRFFVGAEASMTQLRWNFSAAADATRIAAGASDKRTAVSLLVGARF